MALEKAKTSRDVGGGATRGAGGPSSGKTSSSSQKGEPRALDMAKIGSALKAATAPTDAALHEKISRNGGGTTAQDAYVPGAVPVYPDANTAAVVDTLAQAIPGYGLVDTLYKGGKLATGNGNLTTPTSGMLGDVTGANYGPQRGFQPDRYRGQASLGGIGGSGGAVNSGDTREIPGRSYGAGAMALTGDEATDPGSTDQYGDVTLRDRRKPKMGAGTSMVMGL